MCFLYFFFFSRNLSPSPPLASPSLREKRKNEQTEKERKPREGGGWVMLEKGRREQGEPEPQFLSSFFFPPKYFLFGKRLFFVYLIQVLGEW